MIAARDRATSEATDECRQHCVAAGLIARYCSVTEAAVASIGKELRDLFTPGDASWRDLHNDRAGIHCARTAHDDEQVRECCEVSCGKRE